MGVVRTPPIALSIAEPPVEMKSASKERIQPIAPRIVCIRFAETGSAKGPMADLTSARRIAAFSAGIVAVRVESPSSTAPWIVVIVGTGSVVHAKVSAKTPILALRTAARRRQKFAVTVWMTTATIIPMKKTLSAA